MNSKKIVSLLALSALMLSACGLTKKDSESESQESDVSESQSESQDQSDSSETGPIVSNVTFETGKKASLQGHFEFANDSASVDGAVIHVEYDDAKDSTTIYTIDAGEAKLVSENVTVNVTVNYGFISGDGVNALNLGNDYAAFKNGFLQDTFRGPKDVEYAVGNQNTLKLDVGFSYNTYVLEDGEYVKDRKTINLDEAIAKKYVYTDASQFNIEIIGAEAGKEYGVVNDDLTVTLNEEAVGEELTFKVSVGGKSVEQTALVNDGVNVYNSKDLKTYFENPQFKGTINILRSFEAEYEEDQVFTYQGKTYLYDTNGSEEESLYQGSIYFRRVPNNQTPVEINGNYMVLDGTNLPLHYDGSALDTDLPAEIQKTQAEPINGLVCNPQEGLFRTFCDDNSANMEVMVKNFNIRGNSNTGTPENPSTSSAGLIGFVSNRTTLNVTNCILDYAVYGVASYSQNATLELRDSIISNTWGSSICTYRSHDIKIYNSLLTKAGTAAVWLLNNPKEGQQGNLLIDNDSVVDNYVDTDAAWFNAYKLDMLGVMASKIDNAVNDGAIAANAAFGDKESKAHTIFNNAGRFNFVALVQADTDIKEPQYAGRPYANVNIHGASSLVSPTQYVETAYQDTSSDLFLLTAIFGSSNNSIVKALGVDDVTFATTMRLILNNAVQAAMGMDISGYTAGQIAQMAENNANLKDAISGAFANTLSRVLTARSSTGAKTYIGVDASIASFTVGAVIEVKPVA